MLAPLAGEALQLSIGRTPVWVDFQCGIIILIGAANVPQGLSRGLYEN